MSVNTNQWVLFGYDLRGIGQLFLNAWREVFWAQGAPIRELIDEPVEVLLPSGSAEVVGRGGANIASTAVLLPEDIVLTKTLSVPKMAGINPTEVVSNEVYAASPFAADDTAYGWRVLQSDSSTHNIGIAIVSKSSAMAYVHSSVTNIGAKAIEMWAAIDGNHIVLSGFGEDERHNRYRSRLKKTLGLVSAIVLLLVLCAAVPVVFKSYHLAATESAYNTIQEQAKSVVAARSELAVANQYIDELNSLVSGTAQPVYVLNLLSQNLPDDAWLTNFEQEGNDVTIDGVADNGAALMQQMSQYEGVENVRAVSGIRKVGRNGEKERFSFAFVTVEGNP